MIAALYAPRKVVALFGVLCCAFSLAGCQLYWTKPGATLATFSEDHKLCVEKAGAPLRDDQVLVNEAMYKACLKGLGWSRQTGSMHSNPAGYYRGLEEDAVVRAGEIPAQVGQTERGGRIPPSRVHLCRQTYLMTTNWRDRMPDFYACLEAAR